LKFDPDGCRAADMTANQIHERLRKRALSYPGATEAHPWGETAIKVNGKGFLFMGMEDNKVSMSVKLPFSRDMSHDLPFAEPTHYRMGIDESYRAIAPKKKKKK
jgi:hypothetical protein